VPQVKATTTISEASIKLKAAKRRFKYKPLARWYGRFSDQAMDVLITQGVAWPESLLSMTQRDLDKLSAISDKIYTEIVDYRALHKRRTKAAGLSI
jgi:predicted amidophosphoribosyltransferase